jgi:predicted transcriptional regulator
MAPAIDDTLRKAIKTCGLSANELARETGVPQPTITRFLAGADMRISTAAKIATYLELVLVEKP